MQKFWSQWTIEVKEKGHNFIYQREQKTKILKHQNILQFILSHVVYDSMFGLTISELWPAKVASASQNQKIVMCDSSKTIALVILKISQPSSESKGATETKLHQNPRHEGVKFEKSGMICCGMPLIGA